MRRHLTSWRVGALFFALAIVHTWPLASDLTHLSRIDNADTQLTTAFVVRPDRWWGRRGLIIARRLGGAALAAAVVIVLVLWPYAVVNEGGPIQRSLSVPATLDQYLATGGRLHYGLWSHRFYVAGADALFPGLTAVVLAGVALVSRRTDRARMAMFGGIAIVGGVLSLGPATPFYGWLLWAFPPAHAIRATSRFGYLLLFGVAGLAGLGLFVLRPWFRSRHQRDLRGDGNSGACPPDQEPGSLALVKPPRPILFFVFSASLDPFRDQSQKCLLGLGRRKTPDGSGLRLEELKHCVELGDRE